MKKYMNYKEKKMEDSKFVKIIDICSKQEDVKEEVHRNHDNNKCC